MSAFVIRNISRPRLLCVLPKSVHCRQFSVSTDEVNKFSALSSTWWDEKENPLLAMNPTRIARMRQVLDRHFQSREGNRSMEVSHSSKNNNIFQDLKALDVGCGGGLLSESLARLGANVTAIDPSVEIVQVAKEHASRDKVTREGIDFRGGFTIEKLASEILPSSANSELFDVVCVLEVIEHSPDPKGLLSHAVSMLKKPADGHPGGVLFVSTINKTAKSYAFAIVGAEYIARFLPIGTHSWDNFVSPSDVQNMLPEGICQVDVCGMVLRPGFIIDFRLDKDDTDVNWIGSYAWRKSEMYS